MIQVEPGMVAHTSTLSTWEAEVKGSAIQGQPGLNNKTLYQKSRGHQLRFGPGI
jgi:hypothetical protein